MEALSTPGGHGGGSLAGEEVAILTWHWGWGGLSQGGPALRGSRPGRRGLSGEQGRECVLQGEGPSSAPHRGGRREEARLGLPRGAWPSQTPPAGSWGHRGSLPKLLLLFFRLALVKGMSRDSRRKGRGWGISGAGAGGMAELLPRGELRPGGEL